MKKVKVFALIIFGLISIQTISAQQLTKDAIVGEWLSENKEGKVQVYRQGDKFFGKITWGKDGSRKDVKNPDDKLKSQNIVGSVILKGFDFTGKSWENGTIYDPNNGKTYSSIMKMSDNNTLTIRGFVGISLLGRSTVWTRAK